MTTTISEAHEVGRCLLQERRQAQKVKEQAELTCSTTDC